MTHNRSALLLVFLSVTSLAAGDAIVRLLVENLHVGQVIAFRGVLLIIILAGGLLITGYRFRMNRLFHRWSMLRALSETIATFCFFSAVQFVPIAIATTIVFIFPIILTLVSIPLYGEKVGPWRWFAVMMGFIGVMIISNPAGETFSWVMILPLMSAFGLVGGVLSTRNIPKNIPATEITLTTAIISTAVGFMSLPFGWQSLGIFEITFLPIAAGLVALAFVSYIIAIRKGELSLIAPVQYLVIFWATFWGAVIWNEYPSYHAILGGMLIITAGGVILWREYVHSKKQKS